ncbi:MAG: hypothetical protein ACOC3Z_00735 [Nanoarchaeota archaeon]
MISLGGSAIIPNDKIDLKFLRDFRKLLLKHSKDYKIIVSCGGGTTARKYINALDEFGSTYKMQSYIGIDVTRMHAKFINYIFGNKPLEDIPRSMNDVKKKLKIKDIIICGAFQYKPNQTSDSSSAEIAKELNCSFINLTNVAGYYDKNPKKHKNAKLIPRTTWKDFNKAAIKMKFHPGQHFVLDQKASKIIMKNKIPTYIIGNSIKQLDNVLSGKKYNGTLIFGEF